MEEIYNVFCDESCHLEKDNQPIMAFGAIWCPKSDTSRLASEIRERKVKFRATGEFAEHFFGEQGRVREGLDCWRRGDLARFGSPVILFNSLVSFLTASITALALSSVDSLWLSIPIKGARRA